MQAFLNDIKVKRKYLIRVRAHRKADEIVKGHYWEGGKGCAVGCTIHGSDHSRYPVELGIPEWLARVEDTLFEGMTNERAKLWPEQFLSAIKVGADLEKVNAPFLVLVLKSSLVSMAAAKYDAEAFPEVKAAMGQAEAAIAEMIRCHEGGLDLSAAESAARSAARSAESAAWSAARSAESAARSAESAARSAAWSAESAARSAASAAWSAARSAESAAESVARYAESAARSAESAARSAFEKFADELLKLLKGCK